MKSPSAREKKEQYTVRKFLRFRPSQWAKMQKVAGAMLLDWPDAIRMMIERDYMKLREARKQGGKEAGK